MGLPNHLWTKLTVNQVPPDITKPPTEELIPSTVTCVNQEKPQLPSLTPFTLNATAKPPMLTVTEESLTELPLLDVPFVNQDMPETTSPLDVLNSLTKTVRNWTLLTPNVKNVGQLISSQALSVLK